MADQRPWIKLWKSFRTDPDILRLGLEGEARWVHLLLFIAAHDREGTWSGPLRTLVHALDYRGRGDRPRRAASAFLRRLPGVTVTASGGHLDVTTGSPQGHTGDLHVTPIGDGEQGYMLSDPITVTVTFINWAKYQESNSVHRTRRWREKRHGDGSTPSQASPCEASQASPNVTRSRSRRDKNPPTPRVTRSPETHQPAALPTYPEPDPNATRQGLEAIKAILNRTAMPIPQPVQAEPDRDAEHTAPVKPPEKGLPW